MAKEIISDSNLLESLFGKKDSNFLNDTDRKYEALQSTLEEQRALKIDVIEKGCHCQEKVECEKCLDFNIEEIHHMMTIIKELNQAVIRLIVNMEIDTKYKSQEVMQTEIFIKDKIEEYVQIEKNVNKMISKGHKLANKVVKMKGEAYSSEVLDQVAGEDIVFDYVPQNESASVQLQVEQPAKRRRSGSALSSVKAIVERETQEVEHQVKGNDTLLISEKEEKVFLPYTIDELNQYLCSYPQEYKGYEDVIEKEFVLPLDGFVRNQSVSRFKETYHLVRNKEMRSMIEAMKVSSKLMFQYDVNPAVIAACKSKKELNQYMHCIEQNKLEDFSCFKIKFDLNLL